MNGNKGDSMQHPGVNLKALFADQTENFATVAAAKAKEVAGQMEMFIHNI